MDKDGEKGLLPKILSFPQDFYKNLKKILQTGPSHYMQFFYYFNFFF